MTTTDNLCDVCEVLPGRDGYCHGCALDCIEGFRLALVEVRRERDAVEAERDKLRTERRGVIDCVNLFGDEVLHDALTAAGLLLNPPRPGDASDA